MPIKYLELDSSYRNRNLFTNPSSFSVKISQTGLNNQFNAVDPITDSYPIKAFSIVDETRSLTLIPAGTAPSTSSPTKIICTCSGPGPLLIMKSYNYFAGAVLYSASGYSGRILEWEYLKTQGADFVFLITLETAIPAALLLAATAFSIGQMSLVTSDTGYIFVPSSPFIQNWYNNYYILNITNQQATQVTNFDKDTHLIQAKSNISGWTANDILILYKSLPKIFASGNYYVSGTIATVTGLSGYITGLTDVATNIVCDSSYINSFVNSYDPASLPSAIINTSRIVAIVLKLVTAGVTTYVADSTGNGIYTYSTAQTTVSYTNYIITDKQIANGYNVQILPYSRDNCSPFTYNGSITSQNQPVSYEVTLNSLTLPNTVLYSGGRIAYYPYIYVEIENEGSSSTNINSIYSNNPNTYKAVFKVPITDLNHPANTPFVKLTGNGMVQTIVFKPNSDMKVSVKLSDGTLFQTEDDDTSAGQSPNPLLQTSFMFGLNRI